MPDSWKCKECGTESHPASWSHKLCPRCLMAAGLGELGDDELEKEELESEAPEGGRRVDQYRIIREIGSGSQGIVYEAEQLEPGRPVALKVVRGGQDVDDELGKLFRREIQTLARLEHPGIASIYESGSTSEGESFFAMELVDGRTLSEFLEERSEKVGSPEETRLRVTLFQRICEAVNYAHQRGVIHRDLKPSNILVLQKSPEGASAVPGIKILDFGLARIFDPDTMASTMTEIGRIKGTLPYMSPEQMRGDSTRTDVRTDVYSLGVVLYEMLTGRRPHSYDAPIDFIRGISSDPPTPFADSWPGTRGPDQDLETIVRKTLEKDPDQRYQSPLALAEDLERYLTNQPIQARPPSTTYQLRKLISRHRVPVGLAAGLVVLLVGLAVSTTIQARRIAAEAQRADREAVSAQWTTDFLLQLFRDADPFEKGPDTITVREIVDLGAQRIRESTAYQPAVSARLMGTLGGIYSNLGLFDQAAPLLEEALSTSERLSEEDSVEKADAMLRLGNFLVDNGQYERATILLSDALAMNVRLMGDDHETTVLTRLHLGNAYYYQSKFAEAEVLLEQSLEQLEGLFGTESPRLSLNLNYLAMLYDDQARRDEALELYERALAIDEASYGEDDPRMVETYNNLAELYRAQKRFDEAEPLYQHGLSIVEAHLPPDHLYVATLSNNLALNYRGQKRYAEAEPLYQRVLSILKRALPEHPHVATTLNNIGVLWFVQGEYEKAEPYYVEGFEHRKRVLDPEHHLIGESHHNLAMLRDEQDRNAEADRHYRSALRIREKALGPEHPAVFKIRETYAAFLEKIDEREQARMIASGGGLP